MKTYASGFWLGCLFAQRCGAVYCHALKSRHLDVVLTSFQTSFHMQLSRPSRPDISLCHPGKEMVWASRWSVALSHTHNVGPRPPGCRSWSGGCSELAFLDVAECRWGKDSDLSSSNVCGHGQNRPWASQCVSVLSGPELSPEISETTAFRWYTHATDFPPKSQTWWDFEPAKWKLMLLVFG